MLVFMLMLMCRTAPRPGGAGEPSWVGVPRGCPSAVFRGAGTAEGGCSAVPWVDERADAGAHHSTGRAFGRRVSSPLSHSTSSAGTARRSEGSRCARTPKAVWSSTRATPAPGQ